MRKARILADLNSNTYQFEDDTPFILVADFYVEEDMATIYMSSLLSNGWST